MEPTKTKLVEFGRFAQRHAAKHGRKRPETIYFRGFTLYCTRNLKGNFRIGMRTEKSRLRRSLMSLQDLLRRIRHLSVREQVNTLNAALRGHYAYYGIAGNFRSLQKLHRAVERYWHKMLCSRSWAGRITWDMFHQIKLAAEGTIGSMTGIHYSFMGATDPVQMEPYARELAGRLKQDNVDSVLLAPV